MSWRDYADLAQEVILDTMADRDGDGALTITYAPKGGTPRLIRGIFREPHIEKQLDAMEPAVSTWEHRLGVKIAELEPDWPIPRDSRILIERPEGGDPLDHGSTTSYEIIDRQLDGEGLVELRLRRKE